MVYGSCSQCFTNGRCTRRPLPASLYAHVIPTAAPPPTGATHLHSSFYALVKRIFEHGPTYWIGKPCKLGPEERGGGALVCWGGGVLVCRGLGQWIIVSGESSLAGTRPSPSTTAHALPHALTHLTPFQKLLAVSFPHVQRPNCARYHDTVSHFYPVGNKWLTVGVRRQMVGGRQ